jgi:two-component system, OmpR family, phosphate regulon sensor histidine kinase PhoR
MTSPEDRARRLKDDFLSIVSHELRTPLTSIQGYSQLLEGRLRGAPERNAKELAHLAVIRSQVARMRRLVDDLLDVSRIDRRGGVSIEPEPIDLAEELREVVARTRREHPEREVELEIPETLPVEADRDRIAQVLANLVDNALKYSPQGGAISLTAAPEPDGVSVSLADLGIGIPSEQLDLVFERFYQADDDAGRRRFTGLGLGLYICRAIVESHGGSISAAPNSTAGRGTVITFRLPLQAKPSLPPLAIGEVPPFVVRGGGETER